VEYQRGSLGKPVFGVEVKLVDPDGNEVVEPNRDGEAWVKSRTASLFYWRKFERTKETFVGQWTRTGDTLRFDEDGFFWFVGRNDDLFKVKGLWVSPVEVEAAITQHATVLEAAVIPFSDADGLTKPKAFVVLRPGVEPSPSLAEELKQAVRHVGGYKAPEIIDFVEALPRTTLLKIDRSALRAQEATGPRKG
jgi:benzoate-CoA ligase